jgi:hypothetical protein
VKEDKTEFEDLEKKLEVDIEDMANSVGLTSRSIYGYRSKRKINFFTVIIYGTYLLKSGLDIDEIVKIIELAKYLKNKKETTVDV